MQAGVLAATAAAIAFTALAPGRAGALDESLLAHRLYTEDRRAVGAAEVFTGPAWKGLALYRSGQWWRAADVRNYSPHHLSGKGPLR